MLKKACIIKLCSSNSGTFGLGCQKIQMRSFQLGTRKNNREVAWKERKGGGEEWQGEGGGGGEGGKEAL